MAIRFLPVSARRTLQKMLYLTCLFSPVISQAGRPLNTDDAGANNQAVCQLEAWQDHLAHDVQSRHLAPACGLVDGLEFGFELISNSAASDMPLAHAWGLKWAPDWASWQGWRFGLRAATAKEKSPEDGRWRQAAESFFILASRPLSEQWTLHLNLGRGHNKLERHHDTPYSVALAWAPSDRWLVFGELFGQNNESPHQAVGLRYWLLPDSWALDLTGGRVNAASGSRSWGIGLGWYGIRF
jgi:hypothetical protein